MNTTVPSRTWIFLSISTQWKKNRQIPRRIEIFILRATDETIRSRSRLRWNFFETERGNESAGSFLSWVARETGRIDAIIVDGWAADSSIIDEWKLPSFVSSFFFYRATSNTIWLCIGYEGRFVTHKLANWTKFIAQTSQDRFAEFWVTDFRQKIR